MGKKSRNQRGPGVSRAGATGSNLRSAPPERDLRLSATTSVLRCGESLARRRYRRTMTAKERLRQALDTMAEEEAGAALRTLAEASGDPVAWMLDHAPIDDEPETDDERQAVAEARADRERGIEPVSLEDVKAEFGTPMRSPARNAMERAISDDLAGRESHVPNRVAFIDVDEPHAGHEIAAALDRGYAVALTSSDGRERILNEHAWDFPACGH